MAEESPSVWNIETSKHNSYTALGSSYVPLKIWRLCEKNYEKEHERYVYILNYMSRIWTPFITSLHREDYKYHLDHGLKYLGCHLPITLIEEVETIMLEAEEALLGVYDQQTMLEIMQQAKYLLKQVKYHC